jgi:osmoprotectant transport system permease protein
VQEVNTFFNFIIDKRLQIYDLFIQHIQLTLLSVIISILVGIPLGILIVKAKKLSTPIITVANIVQSIPSLALLGFLIPVLGIGSKPAIAMVVLYSLLPIVKNTYTGLTNINPSTIEAAKGIGLTNNQILLKVRFPLAMPIIMSGIRISAVTAVGLMTIAAFIGAGGLGYLVFSGVQTVNNNMILAGAIPACILAIVLDFIIAKIENIVTPDGIKNSSERRKKSGVIIAIKKYKIAISVVLLICIIGGTVFGYYKNKNTIVVGSKNFNEQLVLGNMLASLIEDNTDYKVERKLNLGGTNVLFDAMKTGNVDLCVEYTGTGLVNIMKQNSISDKDKVYNIVKGYFHKNYQMEWMKTLGFNNTYVLAMNKDVANKYNLNTISDLAKVSNQLNLGSTMEFINRSDGYLGLQKLYGLNFKSTKGLDGGLRYSALEKNETQVVDAFSTDGLLKKFNLKTLKDDKNFFPPYYAAPLVREDTLEKYPKIRPLLEKLEGKITEEDMRSLNYRVDNGEDPKVVAEDFLRNKGLIK